MIIVILHRERSRHHGARERWLMRLEIDLDADENASLTSWPRKARGHSPRDLHPKVEAM
jgi:hypothetical protein